MAITVRHLPTAARAPTASDTASSTLSGSEGLVPRLLTRWLFRQALVERNDRLGPGLHRITLAGPGLCGVRWTAGDTLLVKMSPGLQTRTYTPMSWDPERGCTTVLAHALAAGRGSEWVRRARPGQAVSVFGPRRSLDLAGLDAQRGVLVGDETAIGLAVAWKPARTALEVDSAAAIEPVLAALGLQAACTARRHEGRHLNALSEVMLAAGTDHHFVLAGRAQTLQILRHALRSHGVASGRIVTQAHWADGTHGRG